MRPADLRSIAELAVGKPHGHKMKYMAGCRCAKCRRGNAAYERKMADDRKRLGPNDRVPADRALAHLLMLRKAGMGHKTVHKHARVAASILGAIIWGGKKTRKYIRRRTEARILAVQPTLDLLPKRTLVPAGETVAKLRQLICWGYPKLLINRDAIGKSGAGLQILALEGKASNVAAKTAIRIRDFYAKIVAIRSAWRTRNGNIPLRHYVYWKQGRSGVKVRDLELMPFAVSYDYHYKFPQDLKDAIYVNNQLRKTYRERKKSHAKKQNVRSSQSSFRDARSA